MNLPIYYLDYMKGLLGDEYSSYIDSLNRPSYHGLRVNRLKISKEELKDKLSFSLEEIPFIDNGYIYADKENPAKDVYYHAGLYYLQEPSAMLPANRLPIEKGDRVLDLCAAPGGKATELAGKLSNTGLLYANDISASRALALLKNLELTGASNIFVTAEKPENLSVKFPLFFNKILCDVPCSGEGMFRKEPSLIKSWIEKGPEYYQNIQRTIIDNAYEMLCEGGLLMYSTCTFNEKEDEENIAYFLDKHKDMELIDIEGYEGFSNGRLGLTKCVRVFPHKMIGEGHFMALLKKKGECVKCDVGNDFAPSKIISIALKNKKEAIDYKLPPLKDNGYREGIRYIRTGLMLSESQAYAMTLNSENFDNCLNLTHDDIRTVKYIKGETIFLNENETLHPGLSLILCDNYPLGFAKSDKSGKLKNLLNKSYRMN